ncbi:MAG TPA: hypothetical protein VHE37_14785 [Nevskiaceae bacterium]|nr:hypothetical protein [Nevskiaceae bacterium]
MMRMSRVRTAAMLLALLLGQWLNLAHGFIHPVDAGPDAHCQMCLHAQGMDSGAIAPVTHLPPLAVSHEIPALPLRRAVISIAADGHRIRGPPLLVG